jgi:hypothetical protein
VVAGRLRIFLRSRQIHPRKVGKSVIGNLGPPNQSHSQKMVIPQTRGVRQIAEPPGTPEVILQNVRNQQRGMLWRYALDQLRFPAWDFISSAIACDQWGRSLFIGLSESVGHLHRRFRPMPSQLLKPLVLLLGGNHGFDPYL